MDIYLLADTNLLDSAYLVPEGSWHFLIVYEA